MLVYNVSATFTSSLTTTVPIATVFTNTAAASNVVTGRSVLILEIDVEGSGNASNYMEFGFYRLAVPTGTATSATFTQSAALTPQCVDQNTNAPGTLSPAAQCTWTSGTFAAGSTYPAGLTPGSFVAQPVHRFGVNVNGQRYFWRANPNLSNAIIVPGSGVVSNLSYAGALSLVPISVASSPNVSFRIQFAEL